MLFIDARRKKERNAKDRSCDKIHELRIALHGIQYRILYFFHDKSGVISHGLIKTGKDVPPKDIDLAGRRKEEYEKDPLGHTYGG